MGEGSAGNAHPHHVRSVLSLFIDATRNALGFEDAHGDLVVLETLDVAVVGVDIRSKIMWKVVEGFTHLSLLQGGSCSVYTISISTGVGVPFDTVKPLMSGRCGSASDTIT